MHTALSHPLPDPSHVTWVARHAMARSPDAPAAWRRLHHKARAALGGKTDSDAASFMLKRRSLRRLGSQSQPKVTGPGGAGPPGPGGQLNLRSLASSHNLKDGVASNDVRVVCQQTRTDQAELEGRRATSVFSRYLNRDPLAPAGLRAGRLSQPTSTLCPTALRLRVGSRAGPPGHSLSPAP